MTLEHALVVAVGALATAVIALWKRMLTEFSECKRDREILRGLIMERMPNLCGAKNCNERIPMGVWMTTAKKPDKKKPSPDVPGGG